MALTYGRLVTTNEPTTDTPSTECWASGGKVVPEDVTAGAVRSQKMIEEAESQIAARWATFEERLAATRAQMLDEVRADVERELSSKFIELSTLREREIERSREQILQLSCLLAERVLREELSTRPERLIRFAENCIAQIRGSSSVVIHANPEDIHVLKASLEALAAEIAVTIRLESHPELARGDLHIESDVGTLDARVGTQLANLAETIRESLRP